MTDLEICNLALTLHSKVITQEQLDSKDGKEAYNCSIMLPIAKRRTLGEYDWSFFTTLLDIDYTDSKSGFGFPYGYILPSGLVSVVPQEQDDFSYRVLNGRLYTDVCEPPIWGITEDSMEYLEHPEEFDTLVGFSLSFLLCGPLAPGDNTIATTALRQYSWTKQSLIRKECSAFYKNNGSINEDNEHNGKARLPKPHYVRTEDGSWILE